MAKLPQILLIEDDPKVVSQITEALREKAEVLAFNLIEDIVKALGERPKCLTVIDFDLKENDGFYVLRRLKQLNPYLKSIMLSSANNIPLAVAATKLGVMEFLRKPLILPDFVQTVEKLSREEELRRFSYEGISGTEWLKGNSAALLGFEENLMRASRSLSDLIIFAERGINKKTVIRLIHRNGPNEGKKLVEIDLNSFRKESLEGHFWATLNELLSEVVPSGIRKEEEEPATVFLEGFETISEHFRMSIFDFMKNKGRKPGINREVKVILGICDPACLPKLMNFEILTVPTLRERKGDLPAITAEYIRNRTNIISLAGEALDLLSYYDFPGNYEELENLLRSSMPSEGTLNYFNLGQASFLSYLASVARMAPLNQVRELFEKKLFKRLIDLSGKNLHLTARFLNLPKTVLDDRIRDLNL